MIVEKFLLYILSFDPLVEVQYFNGHSLDVQGLHLNPKTLFNINVIFRAMDAIFLNQQILNRAISWSSRGNINIIKTLNPFAFVAQIF